MAQQLETEQNVSGIAHERKRKWGYDVRQVDDFLERAHSLYESEDAQLTQEDIQNASFDLQKGGYVIAQVDAALTRLERAVVDKRTTWEVTERGRVGWKAETEDLFRRIEQHARRDQGERFKPGDAKRPSYDRKQVDRLIDQIVDRAATQIGIARAAAGDARNAQELNSKNVANVLFTQRTGKRGYDERQVDYYLNVCVQLLSRLESYARVADYTAAQENAAGGASAAAPVRRPASTDVLPLFSGANQYAPSDSTPALQDNPRSFAPAAGAAAQVPVDSPDASSFEALHSAEQQIFQATPAQSANGDATESNVPEQAAASSSLAALAHIAEASPRLDADQSGEPSAGEATAALPPEVSHTLAEQGVQTTSFSPDIPSQSSPAATADFKWPSPQQPAVDVRQPAAVQQPTEPQSARADQPVSFAPPAKPEHQWTSPQTPGVEPQQQVPAQERHVPEPNDANASDSDHGAAATSDFPISFDDVSASQADERLHFAADEAAPAGNARKADSRNAGFPALFSDSESSINLDIPDLSFPVLDHETGKDGNQTDLDGGFGQRNADAADSDEKKLGE